MENNIIFLDIDGVLNQCQTGCYIDKLCLKVLIDICKKLNANIVLSSSWRVGFSLFGECSKEIQNLIDLLEPHGIKIVGRTPRRANREIEIKEYLRTHDVTNYLIIDDVITDIEECADENWNNSDVSIAIQRALMEKLNWY